RHGRAGLDHRRRGEDCLHRTRKPMGEWLHRELQCSPARRTPRRRDLLRAQRGQDHRGKLASALQHRASAWIARLQAAGAGGLHPGIRAGGPATPTSDAARAGATTIIALTIKLDPSVGADHADPALTPQQTLEKIVWEGAARRYPEGVPDHVRATLRHELELIEKLDYAPYFLTVNSIV